MTGFPDRCRVFRRLHQAGCFVIPNPWDVGSARLLARLGFPALATTSSGFAWSMGRPDNGVSLTQALAHYRAVAESVEVPVNADFEGGFATEPAEVGANVLAATGTGVAGLSIEDSTGDPARPLLDFTLAAERIRAARRAIDESGSVSCSPADRRASWSGAPIWPRRSAGSRHTGRRAPIASTRRASVPGRRLRRWSRGWLPSR